MKAIMIFDDLDYHAGGKRTPADVTVRLAYEGETVELDLTKDHAEQLFHLVEPYLRAGTDIPAGRTAPRPTYSRKGSSYYKALAEFAAERGATRLRNGRWPKAIRDEWDARQSAEIARAARS